MAGPRLRTGTHCSSVFRLRPQSSPPCPGKTATNSDPRACSRRSSADTDGEGVISSTRAHDALDTVVEEQFHGRRRDGRDHAPTDMCINRKRSCRIIPAGMDFMPRFLGWVTNESWQSRFLRKAQTKRFKYRLKTWSWLATSFRICAPSLKYVPCMRDFSHLVAGKRP